MKQSDTHTMVKAVSAFLILLVAFGILLLFSTYSDAILQSDSFKPFFVLSAVGFALLLGLMYLINGTRAPQASSGKKRRSR